MADAALVTEDNLAALGDTLFITRLPAPYSERRPPSRRWPTTRGKRSACSPAHKPTKHRPGTAYKVSEGEVTLYGTAHDGG